MEIAAAVGIVVAAVFGAAGLVIWRVARKIEKCYARISGSDWSDWDDPERIGTVVVLGPAHPVEARAVSRESA